MDTIQRARADRPSERSPAAPSPASGDSVHTFNISNTARTIAPIESASALSDPAMARASAQHVPALAPTPVLPAQPRKATATTPSSRHPRAPATASGTKRRRRSSSPTPHAPVQAPPRAKSSAARASATSASATAAAASSLVSASASATHPITTPARNANGNHTNNRQSLPPAPDGMQVQPDGTQLQSDGTQLQSDGTQLQPDGTPVQPQASSSSAFAPAKRATQACLRCRKQKLRCVGGWPCIRCDKGKHVCDFGGRAAPASAAGPSATGGASAAAPPTPARPMKTPGSAKKPTKTSMAKAVAAESAAMLMTPAATSTNTAAGTPRGRQGATPLQDDRFGVPDGSGSGRATPNDDNHSIRSLEASVATLLAGMSGMVPAPVFQPQSRDDDHPSPGWDRHESQTHASQTMVPQSSLFISPPYSTDNGLILDTETPLLRTKPLSTVESDDPTSPSESYPAQCPTPPLTSGDGSRPSSSAVGDSAPIKLTDIVSQDQDPIGGGIVREEDAQDLFTLFATHIHTFTPVLDVTSCTFQRVRYESPFLLSAILAISARFYSRYSSRLSHSGLPQLSRDVPAQLAALAEWHLAQSLLRRPRSLLDVQAILLLAAWRLQPSGEGSDPWVVAGHADRVARRIGLDREVATLARQANSEAARPPSAGWSVTDAQSSKWRTWLSVLVLDGLTSLGAYPPQAQPAHDLLLDETLFLDASLTSPSALGLSNPPSQMGGDVYIASQVQLARIARDLVAWTQALCEPEPDARPYRPHEFRAVLRHLGARTEEWYEQWIWTGSRYHRYFLPIRDLNILHYSHLSLVLHSVALNAPLLSASNGDIEQDKFMAEALAKGFQAAMDIILTHSYRSDPALSFAPDHLTMSLAQAATFLVHVSYAPAALLASAKISSPTVLPEHVKIAVEVLAAGDLSETRLGTSLSRIVARMARQAGMDVPDAGDGDSDGETGGMEWKVRPESGGGEWGDAEGELEAALDPMGVAGVFGRGANEPRSVYAL